MKKPVLGLCLSASVAAGGAELASPPPRSYPIAQAPASLASGIEAADAAIAALQRRLAGRLLEELEAGGPSRAVAVCRDEAQALTAEIVRAQNVKVGRTSHRLRNPGNIAPPWAEPFVAAAAAKKAAAVEAVAFNLGDRVGVLRPIPTGAACTQCHGRPDALSPDVTAVLREAYPADRAVGFGEGDLRGFFWAEAPVPGTSAPPPAAPGRGGDADERARGEQLLAEANPKCTVCHRVAGKGNPQGPLDGVGRRLTREEIKAWLRTPAEMAKKHGKTRKPPMLPYREFSDEELDAMAAYIASLDPRSD